ncbi:MAG TPA: hypothetical protein VGQ72_07805, partial [Pyrinomonadaceae bacterium]|nr:hypothetical protein [Pyrinomonadaceae bacterium]
MCAVLIVLFAYGSASQSLLTQQTPTYRLIAPDLVAQGEAFTGVVVEETTNGVALLNEGDKVVFQGQVMPVEKGGIVKFPPFIKELGNTFLFPQIVRAGGTTAQTAKPQHVEVVPINSGAPTRIARTSTVVSGGGIIRVTGQRLEALEAAALVDRDGKRLELGQPVGSSLQQIYFAPKELPKGAFRFQGRDASGNSYEAPNQTQNPTIKLSGSRITHRGQRGQITVLSDTDGTAILTGGEPQIELDQRVVDVRASA